jgi:hypothetical protein
MMNLFARPIDKKPTLEIIRKVLQGIGQPNFDDGTGVQRQADITNIVLEDEDFGKKFAGLNVPDMPDIDMSDFNKTTLSFTLPSGDYVAKVAMGEFEIKKKMKGRVASIYEHFDKKDLTVMLSDDEKADEVAVRAIIEKFIQEDVSLLNAEDESSYEETVMGIRYDGAYCIDRQVGWLLFGFISKQLGLIRPTESNLLIDIFMLGDSAVRFPELESVMRLEMMQTFNILKENGHDIDNEVESNDMDNYLYYVEKGDIQGNVYISQNNMFLVARHTKTDVIKVWNTMRINDDWMERIHDMADIDEDDNTVFNVAEYLQDFTNATYANQYDYPFEFNAAGYRKSVDLLLEEFETATNDLVYDSKKGYMTAHYMEFNSLALELSYSNTMMTEEYDVNRDVLVLTDMDINSPEYFIRRMTTGFSNSRSAALHYLFTCIGTGFGWNGKTFTDDQNVFKDYAPNEAENDYSPLQTDRAFAFGSSSLLFHLPKDLPEAWRKVVFEMAVYLADWAIKNPDDKEAVVCKDDLAKVFEEYFDEEVLQKVKAAS